MRWLPTIRSSDATKIQAELTWSGVTAGRTHLQRRWQVSSGYGVVQLVFQPSGSRFAETTTSIWASSPTSKITWQPNRPMPSVLIGTHRLIPPKPVSTHSTNVYMPGATVNASSDTNGNRPTPTARSQSPWIVMDTSSRQKPTLSPTASTGSMRRLLRTNRGQSLYHLASSRGHICRESPANTGDSYPLRGWDLNPQPAD
jgi:hypothetical protein